MQTHEVNRLAIGDFAKAVREALRTFGKRCSLRWIHHQCEPARDVKRRNFYETFWLWFQALWKANPHGAELLFEDLCGRVQALRTTDDLLNADWYEAVADCVMENARGLQEAILNCDQQAMKVALVKGIVAKRRLLAMLEARDFRAHVA